MNKQELVESIKQLSTFGSKEYIELYRVLDLVNKLDEPQKITIPQVVADWIEWTKKDGLDLQDAMNLISGEENEKLLRWFYNENKQETFARAWLDGYTVEEEKRYYIRFKFIEDSYSYLTLIKHLNAWTLYSITLDKKFRTEHTRKQLEEAGFGWVFDCPGIEIEEVEG